MILIWGNNFYCDVFQTNSIIIICPKHETTAWNRTLKLCEFFGIFEINTTRFILFSSLNEFILMPLKNSKSEVWSAGPFHSIEPFFESGNSLILGEIDTVVTLMATTSAGNQNFTSRIPTPEARIRVLNFFVFSNRKKWASFTFLILVSPRFIVSSSCHVLALLCFYYNCPFVLTSFSSLMLSSLSPLLDFYTFFALVF